MVTQFPISRPTAPKTHLGQELLLAMIAFSQPTADAGLVAQILVVKVVLEKPFFSWDHNRCDEADSWHERYEQPSVIQPN
jgi:hypothetical protein